MEKAGVTNTNNTLAPKQAASTVQTPVTAPSVETVSSSPPPERGTRPETQSHVPPAPPIPPAGASSDFVTPAPAPSDRLWPHFLWEGLLAILVLVAVFLVKDKNDDAFNKDFWMYAGLILALTSVFSLSIRAGVANLALVPIAGAASVMTLWLVYSHEFGWGAALAIVLAAGVGVGVLMAFIVSVLRVPAWVVSVGAWMFLAAVTFQIFNAFSDISYGDGFKEYPDPPDMDSAGPYFFAGIAALSILGGLLWALPVVRSRLGGAEQGHKRFDLGRVLSGAGALVISSAVAAAVGSIAVMYASRGSNGDYGLLGLFGLFTAIPFLLFAVPALLAAVLLGGVSIFGRRGGIAGTALATFLLILLMMKPFTNAADTAFYWIGGAFVAGLVLSRVVEWTTGRKKQRAVPPPQEPPSSTWDGAPAPMRPVR